MHRECILSVGTNSFHKIHSSTTKPHLPTRLERRATLPIIQVQTPAAGTTPHPSSPAHPVFAEEHFDSIIAVRVRVPAQLDLDPPPLSGRTSWMPRSQRTGTISSAIHEASFVGSGRSRFSHFGRGSGGRSWVVCRSSWLNQSITIEFEVFAVIVEMSIAMFTCYAGYVFLRKVIS